MRISRILVTLSLCPLLAVAVSASSDEDFNSAVGAVSAEITTAREARDVQEGFAAAQKKAYSLDRQGARLRADLNGLADRARSIADGRGQVDYHFSSDLNRLVWDLRDLAIDTEKLSATVVALLAQAPRDRALLSKAKGLQKSLFYLVGRLNGFSRDASFNHSIFVRVRKTAEANTINRKTAASERSAREGWDAAKAFTAELEALPSI